MPDIYVKIRYKDLEAIFEGDLDSVYREVLRWFNKYIPALDIAQKLIIDIDYSKLADLLSRYIFFTREGDIILRDEADKFSQHNKILLVLSGAKLLEFTGKRESSGVSLEELSRILRSSTKSLSSRLSELKNIGYINKDRRNKNVVYSISIKGLIDLERRFPSSD